jgi:tetraacyldisaccharide 4'-kinase
MRRWLESLEAFAIDVILERRSGKRAGLLRGLLFGLSLVYLRIVRLRLALFNKRTLRPAVPGVPVLSVGNLTVGGTGKTPVVELLARELTAGGRRVAILSRGYKSVPRPLLSRLVDKFFRDKAVFAPRVVSDGQALLLDSKTAGDEPFMLALHLRGVVVLVDRDRVKSASYAVEHFQRDVLILDDGFQYLKLKHSINLVLVDSQSPFGNRYLLPRGTLREPPEHLRRATHILLTKCAEPGQEELRKEIRRWNRTAPIIECNHRPLHLRNLLTGEIHGLEYLRERRIGSICGIAVPESFEGALTGLGARIELAQSFADHHRFRRKEVEQFVRRCSRRRLDAVVTTEKDAVRFPRILDPELPILALRVEIELLSGHEAWNELLQRLIQPREVVSLEPVFAL